MGARDSCASATICTMRESTVSRPTASARMTSVPLSLTVPPMVAPVSAGASSVMVSCSTLAERPCALPSTEFSSYVVLGELALDGTIAPVAGVLPAAIGANAIGRGLICPAACGPEAAWASRDMAILAPRSLIAIANHFKGTQLLSRPEPAPARAADSLPDLSDIKGQETAKRALEVAAAVTFD